mgnify:CR=1 FL=1
MSIVSTVEEQYPTLSRQERKVALKVIQSPKEVQKMTISSLAKTVDVSNATITRFVKKMGCTNFYNFKLQLAESPAPKAPSSVKRTRLPIKSTTTTKRSSAEPGNDSILMNCRPPST